MQSKDLNRYNLLIISLAAISFCLSGCYSYMMEDAQLNLRSSYIEGDIETASNLLQKYGENVYQKKDEVLWSLENGMVQHLLGNYDSSNVFFSRAEIAIEENLTKSLSRGFLSVVSNDNNLAYDGEPYEDIYLNAFKAINYIHLEDWEAALVETRRMTFKLEQLEIRLNGLAQAFANDSSSYSMDWGENNVNIQSSALSHFLASILYAKSGKPDDARIEFTRLERAFQTQSEVFGYPAFDTDRLSYITDPGSYNVLISGFTGGAPYKYPLDFRFFLDEGMVKFSIPAIELYPTEVNAIRVTSDDTAPVYLDLIEEMDMVAKEVYESKLPIIKARAVARSLAKRGGVSILENRIEKENKTAGFIAGLIGMLYQETSENADLRGWQTMPGQAWMKAIWLPPGDHQIIIEYLDADGNVLARAVKDATIKPSNKLSVIETLYPH